MNYMPRSKDRSRSELQKLSDMPFKEKLGYIWDYYRFFIIGGVLGVIILVSVLTTCGNRRNIGLHIEWDASYILSDDMHALAQTIGEKLFSNAGSQIVEYYVTLFLEDDPSYMMIQENKRLAMLSSGAIDIFILDFETLENYSKIEFLLPLENTLSEIEALYPDTYSRITEETVSAAYGSDEEKQTERIVGIRITDSSLITELGISLFTEAYFCIAVTASNYTNALDALTLFFN
ncbi:MAG: hypothetical protein FWH17_05760 [Oscillospiraceae bacterium]|nr:hypothetical protein [Oscillospiraceae bacterium]